MSDLSGALLLRAGVISSEQLSIAARIKERDGGSLGECLVRIGAVDEESLVAFYHRRMMIPRLGPEDLNRLQPNALALVPSDMAQEFRVLPIEIDAEGSMTVAMADPSDNHACDELAFFADCFIIRAVAAETPIRQAIERAYGVQFTSPPSSQRVVTPGPAGKAPAAPVVPPPPIPLTKLKADNAPGQLDERETTRPGTGHEPLPEPPIQALRDAQDRDQVGRVLLDYFAKLVRRTALFVIRKNQLVGLDARGAGLDGAVVQRFSVPVDQPSVFRDVVAARLPFRGALSEGETDRAFQRVLGGQAGEIVLMPVSVRDRVIAVLFAEGPKQALPDAALHALLREAGAAYERIVFESA